MSQQVGFKDILTRMPRALKRVRGLKGIAKLAVRSSLLSSYSYASIVEYSAKQYAENIIIKYKNTEITYRDFNSAANRVAHYLYEKNIRKGDVVALFMESRPEYLILMLAITKVGAVAALINSSHTGQTLHHSLSLVSPKAVIVGAEVLSFVDGVMSTLDTGIQYYWVPDDETDKGNSRPDSVYTDLMADAQTCSPNNAVFSKQIEKSDPCLYIYTSGTTGLPKASVQRNGKLVSLYSASMVLTPLNAKDTLYSSLPLYHGTALLMCWLPILAGGASLALRRKFSASEFWNDVRKYDATVFGYVGELCRYLLNQPPSADDTNHSIRMMIGNGLRPDLWPEFKKRFQVEEVKEFYGSSEGNVACINIFNLDKTVGMVLGSYAIVQFDTETEEPIRDHRGYLIRANKGEPGLLLGQITIGTPFEGYTDENKNKSKILESVFNQGDKWFNTGDTVKNIGFRHLQFVDRTGDTFRWKGENVSTSEVEKIVGQFNGVREAVAYGVEIPDTNGRAGMASVILNDECDITGEPFYKYITEHLPKYAVPVFIRVKTEFESTGTYKYQKGNMKKEGFNIENSDEPVKVLLPGANSYVNLTKDIVINIDSLAYRF